MTGTCLGHLSHCSGLGLVCERRIDVACYDIYSNPEALHQKRV
jgi:hypothetical protein